MLNNSAALARAEKAEAERDRLMLALKDVPYESPLGKKIRAALSPRTPAPAPGPEPSCDLCCHKDLTCVFTPDHLTRPAPAEPKGEQ